MRFSWFYPFEFDDSISRILLYDLNNGTLLKGKVPKDDLSDTFALNYPYDHSKINPYQPIKKLLTFDSTSKLFKISQKDLKQFKNSFEIPRFVDGKLYALLLSAYFVECIASHYCW